MICTKLTAGACLQSGAEQTLAAVSQQHTAAWTHSVSLGSGFVTHPDWSGNPGILFLFPTPLRPLISGRAQMFFLRMKQLQRTCCHLSSHPPQPVLHLCLHTFCTTFTCSYTGSTVVCVCTHWRIHLHQKDTTQETSAASPGLDVSIGTHMFGSCSHLHEEAGWWFTVREYVDYMLEGCQASADLKHTVQSDWWKHAPVVSHSSRMHIKMDGSF